MELVPTGYERRQLFLLSRQNLLFSSKTASCENINAQIRFSASIYYLGRLPGIQSTSYLHKVKHRPRGRPVKQRP